MAECRTVDVVATITQQTFNADGTVSETTFDVTAESPKVLAIDPYVTIEPIEGGAVITVTDAQGKTTATIYNGKDGRDGQSGVDGFSPTATVSKSGNVATISITDKNGTTSAQVVDGVKGDKGDKGDPGIGIKGDKGDPGTNGKDGKDGADYVLTAADKNDIADLVYGLLTDADNTAYGGA